MSAEHPYQWAVDGPPIGHWQTASGSAEVVMQFHFIFREDGTGEVRSGNALGLNEPVAFEWRQKRSGHLKLFSLYADIPDAEHAAYKHLDVNWDNVRYSADYIETDTGKIPILRDNSPAYPNTFPVSFWDTHFAITLVSRETDLD